jgi:glycerol-3-phosphate dehydrogenase
VVYSVREEGAKTLSDILLRRIRLGITASRGVQQARTIAEIAGAELGWNADEAEQRVKEYEQDLRKERNY